MLMAITITTDKIYNAFYDNYNKETKEGYGPKLRIGYEVYKKAWIKD